MEIVDQEKGIEFLDLKINYVEGKLSVDALAKQFYLHKAIYMLSRQDYHQSTTWNCS